MVEQRHERGIIVGIDIGGSKIALIAADVESGDELARARLDTPDDSRPAAISELIKRSTAELRQTTNGKLAALGVAVPGQVDQEQGLVKLAGNLRGWTNVPLQAMLSAWADVPVWIERDANAGALGERWRGAAQTMNNFIFLALGTGIGAGVVVNGRLHRGYRDSAGEVGNFVMDRKFLGRAPGVHGNLEQLIGGPAIRKRLKRATGQKIGADDAFAVARNNNEVKGETERIADFLAMVVIDIAALLDPQAIIFGGGLSAAGSDLIEPVRERVERELRIRPALIASALGEDAQLHGAVFGALWELDPSLALREDLR
ncbi:MAG: ROK family protein [Thermomicrobiales bacterium]